MQKLLLTLLATFVSFMSFSTSSFATTQSSSTTELVGKLAGSYSVNQRAFHYSVPIDVPGDINGHIPSLSIDYNSQVGNGLLGMSFSLSGLSGINRCAKTIATDGMRGGINIDDNDRLCLDGQRLIVVSGDYWAEGSQYRTEINNYSRITYTGNSFTVETKDGKTLYYGTTTDSNIQYQGKTDTKVWALTTNQDASGNNIQYTYNENNDSGEFTIKSIAYADNTIEFNYTDKTTSFIGYQAGSKITSIQLKINTTTQSTCTFNYEVADTTPQKELLKSVQRCIMNEDVSECLPKVEFEYDFTINNTFSSIEQWSNSFGYSASGGSWRTNRHLRYLADVNLLLVEAGTYIHNQDASLM